ncbi:DUF4209 domain-containing protein [Chitinophaga sp.]|uniref:DUF4209 domain-containing protein n=1 Tax=Chitinophaga sp. TaxID=1869181 RepID=UPI0031DB49AE
MSNVHTIILGAIDFILNEKQTIRSEADISQAIRSSLPVGHKLVGKELAEWYAFIAVEGSRYEGDNWNIYYGPSFIRFIDGTVKPSFTLQDISEDMIIYWETRAKECSHPILIARYAGLVHSFKKKVTGSKTDLNIITLYLENLLKSVLDGYLTNPLICYLKLERLLDLSSSLKLDVIFKDSIDAVRSLEHKYSEQSKPGTWVKSFELLIDKKFNIPDELRNEIINELAYRFNASLVADKDGKFDLSGSEAAFSKLAPYFKKHKFPENLKNLLIAMSNQYWAVAKIANPLMANHYYEKLLNIADEFGDKSMLPPIYKAIQNNNPKILDEMKPLSIEIDISMEMVNNVVEETLSGDSYTILSKLAYGFIFNPHDVFTSVDSNSNLASIITRTLHDNTGRKVATIKPIDKDKEGQVINYYGTFLKASSPVIHYPLRKGIERGIITMDNIMDFIKQSYTIAPSKYPIIEKALAAYLKGDYIISLHLMIPQIEAACLAILENAGEATLTGAKKNDGMNWRILDNILNDKVFIDVVGVDVSIYFRAIFTSNVGWNLRNLICHGITEEGHFSELYADRVFLALLYFGLHQTILEK